MERQDQLQSMQDRARGLLLQGREEQAIALFCRILRSNPEHTSTGRALAHFYHQKGLPEEALQLFQELQDHNQGSAYPYYYKAYLYHLQGEQQQAIREARRALRRDPECFDVVMLVRDMGAENIPGEMADANQMDELVRQAEELAKNGRIDEAIQILEEGVTHNVRYLPALNAFFQLCGENNEIGPAERVFASALSCGEESNFYLHLSMAKLYFACGHLDKCIRSSTTAIQLNPKNHESCLLLVRAAQGLNALDEAERILRDFQAKNIYSASTFYILATIYAEQGEWAKCADAAKGTIMLNPRLSGAQDMYDLAKRKLGEAAEGGQAHAKSHIRDLVEAASRQMDEAESTPIQQVVARARALYNEGLVEEALRAAKESVIANPMYVPGIHFVFKACADHKLLKVAEEIHSTITGSGFTSHHIHLGMAKVYQACNLSYSCVEEVKRAVAINRRAYEAYDILLKLFHQEGNLSGAERLLEEFLVEDPANAQLHLVLAKVYLYMEDWPKAEREAALALDMQPRLNEAESVMKRAREKQDSSPGLAPEPRPVRHSEKALQTSSAHLREARRYEAEGDMGMAFRFYMRWAESTGSTDDFVTAGQIFENLDQLGRAEYAYNKAIQMDAGNHTAKSALVRVQERKETTSPSTSTYAQVHKSRGDKYAQMGKFSEAFNAYLKWAEATQSADHFTTVGRFCEDETQLDKAEAMYVAALNLDPYHELAKGRLEAVRREKLSRSIFSLSRVTDWLEVGLAEKAVEMFADSVGQSIVELSDCAQAIALFQQRNVLEVVDRYLPLPTGTLTEKDQLAIFCRILLHVYQDRSISNAEDLISAAENLGLDKSTILLFCGKALGAMEDWEEALEVLYQSHSLTEENPETVMALATALLMLGRTEESMQSFQTLAAKFMRSAQHMFSPHKIDANTTAVPRTRRFHFSEGLRYYEEGDYEEAARCFTVAAGRDNDVVPALYNLGLSYFKQDKYDLCIKVLTQVRALTPRNTTALWNLLVALFKSDLFLDSSRMLEAYLNIEASQRAWICLGFLKNQLGESKQAVDSLMRARSFSGYFPELTATCGALLYNMGEMDEAWQVVSELKGPVFYKPLPEPALVRSLPESETSLYEQGKISISLDKDYYTGVELFQLYDELTKIGALDTALGFFSTYAKKKHTYFTPVDLLVQVCELQGDIQGAYEALQQYAQRNPGKFQAHTELVHFCLDNGMEEEAATALRTAMRHFPNHQELSRLQESLRREQTEKAIPLMPAVPSPSTHANGTLIAPIEGIDLSRDYYDAEELYEIQSALLESGNYDVAVAFFKRYLAKHPSYVTAIRLLADTYGASGDCDAAIAAYNYFIDRCDDSRKLAGIYDDLAAFCQKYGLEQQAVEARQAALDVRAKAREAARTITDELYDLWRTYQMTKRFDEARRVFSEKLARDPDNPDLQQIMGYVLENLGQTEDAYEHRKRAANAFKRIKTYISLGMFCVKNRMPDEARQAFNAALRLNPDSVEAQRGLATADRISTKPFKKKTEEGTPRKAHLHEMWSKFDKEGDYHNARDLFRHYCDSFPDYAPPFEFLAKAHQQLGDYIAAYDAYQRYCDLTDRGDDETMMRLGSFCESLRLQEEAVEAYRIALTRNPFNTRVKEALRLLEPDGAPEVAFISGSHYREDLAEALCRNPSNADKGERLYGIFIKDRDLEAAERTFWTLQRLHPGEAYLYECLACVYQGLGHPDKALTEVQQAKENAPKGDHTYLDKIGQWAQATLGRPQQLAPRKMPSEHTEHEMPPGETDAGQEHEEPPTPVTVEVPIRGEINLTQIAPQIMTLYQGGLAVTEKHREHGRARSRRTKSAAAAFARAERCLLSAQEASRAGEDRQMILQLCRLGGAMAEYHSRLGSDIALARELLVETVSLVQLCADDIDEEEIIGYLVDYLHQVAKLKSLPELLEHEEEVSQVLRAGEAHTSDSIREILSTLQEVVTAISRYMSISEHSGKMEYNVIALSKLGEARKQAGTTRWPHPSSQKQRVLSVIYAWEDNLKKERAGITASADITLEIKQRRVSPEDGLIPVVLTVHNEGKTLAENVVIRLLSDRDYRAEGGVSRDIDVLVPDGIEEVEFFLRIAEGAKDKGSFGLRFEYEYSDLRWGRKPNNPLYKDTITLVQAPPFEPFDNPYIAGRPIPYNQQERFFGRQDVISQIDSIFSGTSVDNILLMWGVRRVGKTSILQHLLAKYQEGRYIPVFIDMHEFAGAEAKTGELLSDIAERIAEAARARKTDVSAPSFESFLEYPTRTFRGFIKTLSQELSGERILLLFDEFEVMFQKISKGHIDPSVMPFLRNLMQHFPDTLSFAFTGADHLMDMVARYASVMFNIAIPVKVSSLDRAAARGLVVRPVEPFGVKYEERAVDRILSVTACHPYYIQLICHMLMELLHKPSERRFDVTHVDVEKVVDTLVTSRDTWTHFSQLWDPLSVSIEDRLLMSCVAEKMMHDADWVHKDVILETLYDLDFPLEDSEFLKAIGRLRVREFFEERSSPDGGAEFRIPVHLFLRYLREQKPLNTALTEYTLGEETEESYEDVL